MRRKRAEQGAEENTRRKRADQDREEETKRKREDQEAAKMKRKEEVRRRQAKRRDNDNHSTNTSMLYGHLPVVQRVTQKGQWQIMKRESGRDIRRIHEENQPRKQHR
jgi:hypothetical protein